MKGSVNTVFKKIMWFLRRCKVLKAIHKTNAIMFNAPDIMVSSRIIALSGTKKQYEDYFTWLDTEHPEWGYSVIEDNGLVLVAIKKKRKDK